MTFTNDYFAQITKRFNAHCERLWLVDTIQFGLAVTAYLEEQPNLGPEEAAIQGWRERAKEVLREEFLRMAAKNERARERRGAE